MKILQNETHSKTEKHFYLKYSSKHQQPNTVEKIVDVAIAET